MNKKDMELLRQDVKQELGTLKKDMELLRQDVKLQIAPLKRDINWLKWVIMIGLPVIITFIMGLAGAVYYLHSDTQAGTRAFKAEMQAEMQEMQAEMQEMKALILKK